MQPPRFRLSFLQYLAIASAILLFILAWHAGWIRINTGTDNGVNSSARGNFGENSDEAPVTYRIVAPQPVTLITEPDDGMKPILSEIANASTSIDMVMYELKDQEIENALVAAVGRGVVVRVLLNNGLYGSGAGNSSTGSRTSPNQAAFNFLQSHGVNVQWTPSVFALTHQKTLVIDGQIAIIMTFNFTPTYYATARDFGIVDPDAADVAAIKKVFNTDWNAARLQKGSDMNTSNLENGDDLVWSPGSQQTICSMIIAATSSLDIASEELSDSENIQAIAAAAGRGVHVRILMTDNKKWHPAFAALVSAGAEVRIYPARKKALYIHEKIIIGDNKQIFLGSENLTTTSLKNNRELGLFVSTPHIVNDIETTFQQDWDDATKWES